VAQVRLPAASSILASFPLAGSAAPAPQGVAPAPAAVPFRTYQILRSDEVDAKDPTLTSTERNAIVASGVAAATRSMSDFFGGTARKAAKLSIPDAQTQSFPTIAAIVETLPALEQMKQHDPRIDTHEDSERVAEELRNVAVSAFLYAASREDDNDFHLIVGENPNAGGGEVYITMEVSGLPPADAASSDAIKTVRDAYKAFFGERLPGRTYDFYNPPIPIKIEGSLFFDMSHANGNSPGPPTLHPFMPVIWEVHPISNLEFEPDGTS
jgi:hypothetical protein